jgi:hypothetical protein
VVPLALLLLAIVSAGTDARASITKRQVAPGLRLIRIRDPGPVRAFVLSVDPRRHALDVALGARRFPGYGSTVATLAERSDAIAAINGDMGVIRPAHPFARDGELVQTLLRSSDVLGIAGGGAGVFIGRPGISVRVRSSGASVPIERWNSGSPGPGEIVGFSEVAGLLEGPIPGDCWVRFEPLDEMSRSRDGRTIARPYRAVDSGCGMPGQLAGQDVLLASRSRSRGASRLERTAIGERISIKWSTRWPGIVDLSGGFPLLVRDDRSVVRTPCVSEFCLRQPRSGVGITAGCADLRSTTQCRILLAVVDGRREGWSRGATLPEFARLFLRLGAAAALNLDGGGSSTLLLDGRVVNRPSDAARKVPTALMVLAGPDPGEAGLGMTPDQEVMPWLQRRS